MLNPIELKFKTDKDSKSAFRTEKIIKSHDIKSVEFRISFDGLELTDEHTVKVLSIFHDTQSQTNVECEIADGKAIYRPDTSLISQYEQVTSSVYVYHGNQSLDVREFTYSVDLSKIDETALKVKEVYDQSYSDLLADFELALTDYKDSLPNESEIFEEIDGIVEIFKSDGNRAIEDFQQKVSQISALEEDYAPRLANVETNKADKSTTDDLVAQLAQKADQAFVDSQFASIVSGAPKGTYTSLSALQAAYPSGADGIFLTLDNGHWYYWNAAVSAWTDGGIYQGTTVSDKSITNAKLSDDYNHKGVITSGPLSALTKAGTYLVTAGVTDAPEGIAGGLLTVETGASGAVVQHVNSINSSNNLWFRTIRVLAEGNQIFPWKKISFNLSKQLASGTDLNTVHESGEYLVLSGSLNAPDSVSVGKLIVNTVGSWVTQTISRAANPDDIFIRSFYYSNNTASSISEWVSVAKQFANSQLPSDADLNDVLVEGTYLALSTVSNKPDGAGSVILNVTKQGLWVVQDATDVVNPNLTFKRTTNTSGSIRSNWEQIVTKSTLAGSASLGLAGKTVVNLADSIFGNVRGASSVSQAIADNSGAEVLNVAFGGAFASQRPDADWNEMTFYKLSEAISSGDFSSLNREAVRTLRNYFGEHIDTLMAINWQNVDIITLAYGTNDVTGGKSLDNPNDKFDITTYGGALRYGLRNIMTAYPHIKVLIITPIYRYYLDEQGDFIEDSDTRVESGGSFRSFVDKAIEVAEEFKVPYLNAHDKLGINKYNKDIYFNEPDTTHPNPTGNKKYGELIARKLIAGS